MTIEQRVKKELLEEQNIPTDEAEIVFQHYRRLWARKYGMILTEESEQKFYETGKKYVELFHKHYFKKYEVILYRKTGQL